MNRVESALPVSQKYGAKVIIYDTFATLLFEF